MHKFRDWVSFEIRLDSFLDVIVLKQKTKPNQPQKKKPQTQNTLGQSEQKYFGSWALVLCYIIV